MKRSDSLVVRACMLGVACAASITPGWTQVASAQPRIQGDVDGDGTVGFNDLVLLLANWQGNSPQNLGWGVIAPSVRSIHQLQVEDLEATGCLLVLNLDADEVTDLIGLPNKRRGIRALTRPGGWPSWPPPGSALEALMERMASDPESVERLAQQMLDALPPLPSGHQPPIPPQTPPENPDDPGTEPPEIPPEPPPAPLPEPPELPPEEPPETPEPPAPPETPANPVPGELPQPV